MTWIFYSASALVVPFLVLGLIQKVKANLQNRIGPPLFQSYYNLFKLLSKHQVISSDASFLFRGGPIINLCLMIILIACCPWLSVSPIIQNVDIFLFLYLLAAARFFAVVASMDTGSPFGAFASSREVTLSLLTEPALLLSLLAPCLLTHTCNMSSAFSFENHSSVQSAAVWLMAGAGIFLAGLVELSRMPIDDPTTHLELTMVHEAMLIENSGRNLALAELAYALKLTLFFGLSVQCLLHSILNFSALPAEFLFILSIAGIFLLAILVSVLETVLVKLKWSRCPDFIAYSVTMGLFACMAAIAGGG